MGNQRKVVRLPSLKEPVHDSPGFAKKLLADADALTAVGAHIELLGLCEYGCRYCSSNIGNFLRIKRGEFLRETVAQLGEAIAPVDVWDERDPNKLVAKADPALMFVWPDVEARLDAQIAKKGPTWGEGRMLVASQLTDFFSPMLVQEGTSLRIAEKLLTKTGFSKIRFLTKNAAVGRPPFVDLFKEHKDRVLVGLSVGTLDDAWAKAVEIGTSPPSARVRAMQHLHEAGVPAYGMLCPVFADTVYDQTPGRRLEDLLDAIGAGRCQHVYIEAVNDRGNWRVVQSGYAAGSPGWNWFEQVYGKGDRAAWSAYAAELHTRALAKARAEGWELRHLLYEGMITRQDAHAFDGLEGVLLQSPTDDAGWSRVPHIRALQKTPAHGHAEGWKAARIAAGVKVCATPAPAGAPAALPRNGQLSLL